MTHQYIHQFIWGYQEHYVLKVKRLAEQVLEAIGAAPDVEIFLVGVRRPGSTADHPVCLEPESGRWPQDLFEGLAATVEAEIPQHPLSRMHYGDAQSMRDKPEWTRQAVIREQVQKRLEPFDRENGLVSFAVNPGVVDQYDVAVVLQVPQATLDGHAQLVGRSHRDEEFDLSFIRSCWAKSSRPPAAS